MTIIETSDDLVEELQAIFRGDPDALADPYPTYRRLREHAPVLRMGSIVLVSTYSLVREVLSDPDTFSSRRFAGDRLEERKATLDPEQLRKLDALVEHQSLWIAMNDAPDHTRLRKLSATAFTKPRIERLRGSIQAIVDELLDQVEGQDTMNFVSGLSFPLPLRVITALLGASPDRADDIRRWSNEIAKAIGTEYSNVDDAYEALQEFRTYAVSLINELRTTERTDLFAQLVAAEEDGVRLSEDELVGMCVLLLFAGHETTTNLITNGLVGLLQHPDQLNILRNDPSRTGKAVEEFLRWNTSNQAVHRTATRDTEIGGVTIKSGDTIRLLQGAANHDEAMFADSDRLDVTRENAGRHIGFGFGIHSCLGLWIARLETELAITTMLARFPKMSIEGDIEYTPNYLIYGPEEVTLRLR